MRRLWPVALLCLVAAAGDCSERPGNRYGYPQPMRERRWRNADRYAAVLTTRGEPGVLMLPTGPRIFYVPDTDPMREIRMLNYEAVYYYPRPAYRPIFETDFRTYRRNR